MVLAARRVKRLYPSSEVSPDARLNLRVVILGPILSSLINVTLMNSGRTFRTEMILQHHYMSPPGMTTTNGRKSLVYIDLISVIARRFNNLECKIIPKYYLKKTSRGVGMRTTTNIRYVASQAVEFDPYPSIRKIKYLSSWR